MPQVDRGTKRHCAHCGANFYDLNHAPIACPKCGAAYEPAAVLPRGTSRSRPKPLPEPVIENVEDSEAFEEDEVLNSDTDEEDEVADIGGESDDEVPDEELGRE